MTLIALLCGLAALFSLLGLVVAWGRGSTSGQSAAALTASVAELQGRLAALAAAQDRLQPLLAERIDAGFAKNTEAITQLRKESLDTLISFRDKVDAALKLELVTLRNENNEKLEQMRRTVDEKLHATLEQRLGESFKRVSEQLESVHRGLGEMQSLATGVGDLRKVLTNVKTRGSFGEVQLETLLAQILTADQYEKNVAVIPGSTARVEFALCLPGRGDDGKLYLPIDAKFPIEDYQRLLDAQDRGDLAGVEDAARALEVRVRQEARTISDKYLAPPHTTDFAVMYLATEGLYAEALRRPGLIDWMQRECKVVPCGPTTIAAMLNSLQMGFRTLAIEKRSSEVWDVLGAVKTEFAKFGDALAHTKKKLEEATNSIEKAQRRNRVLTRALKDVETASDADAAGLLGVIPDGDDADEVPE